MESTLADVLTVDYPDLRGGRPKGLAANEYAQARRESLEALDTQHIIGNLEITAAGEKAPVMASSVIFRALNGLVFNTHARYLFGLSQSQDGDKNRKSVIDRIKKTVLWNEGDPNIHSGVKR